MENHTSSRRKIMLRVILRLVFLGACMFATIFVSAGRLNYWQGWAYYLMWLGMHLINSFFLPLDLIDERSQVKEGTKKWDKVIYVAIALLSFIVPLVASLDGGRYHWTGNYPTWVNVTAFALIFLGSIVFVFSMHVNKFFSGTVRIQEDRGQYVIDKGPYSIVRHPGYASMLLSYALVGFAMNSIWALLPGSLMAAVFIIRTKLEDATLQNELPGYIEYASRVKYRLFPGIW